MKSEGQVAPDFQPQPPRPPRRPGPLDSATPIEDGDTYPSRTCILEGVGPRSSRGVSKSDGPRRPEARGSPRPPKDGRFRATRAGGFALPLVEDSRWGGVDKILGSSSSQLAGARMRSARRDLPYRGPKLPGTARHGNPPHLRGGSPSSPASTPLPLCRASHFAVSRANPRLLWCEFAYPSSPDSIHPLARNPYLALLLLKYQQLFPFHS